MSLIYSWRGMYFIFQRKLNGIADLDKRMKLLVMVTDYICSRCRELGLDEGPNHSITCRPMYTPAILVRDLVEAWSYAIRGLGSEARRVIDGEL